MFADAVAVNVAVVVPDATVTEAGTVRSTLSLASVTGAPPDRAAWLSVTVQVLMSLWFRLVGRHPRLDTSTEVRRSIVAVFGPAPSVAVRVALWSLGMLAFAVALKVAVVAPDATVTEAGTVRRTLLLDSVTLAPPERAVCVSVTVQVLVSL
jgi:hypothetical protein